MVLCNYFAIVPLHDFITLLALVLQGVLSSCEPKPRECNDVMAFSYLTTEQRESYHHREEIIYVDDRQVKVNCSRMLFGVNWIVIERREAGEMLRDKLSTTHIIEDTSYTSKSRNSHWIGMDKLKMIMKQGEWDMVFSVYYLDSNRMVAQCLVHVYSVSLSEDDSQVSYSDIDVSWCQLHRKSVLLNIKWSFWKGDTYCSKTHMGSWWADNCVLLESNGFIASDILMKRRHQLDTHCQLSRSRGCQVVQGINKCICRHGYCGDMCSYKKKCGNGKCIYDKNIGESVCICNHGYCGITCEISAAYSGCKHGAGCRVSSRGQVKCTCTQQYCGETCSIKHECHNGGMCVDTKKDEKSFNEKYSCACTKGYCGHLCDEINPCHNNQSCSVTHNGNITCECTDGYCGAFCELKMKCENNGNCLKSTKDDSWYCNCKYPFCGQQCMLDLKCHNHGVCITDIRKKSLKQEKKFDVHLFGAVVLQGQTVGCSCPVHYCGMRCEIFCENGGVCEVTHQNSKLPSCKCPSQFCEPFCNRKSPCKNGGTCVVSEHKQPASIVAKGESTTYECRCPVNFCGKRCQHFMSCDNGGHCVIERAGEVVCACLKGFCGVHCEKRDVCLNGATCRITSEGELTCDCVAGYMGKSCSRRDFETTGAVLFTVICLPCVMALLYLPYKWAKRHWYADGCLAVCKRKRQTGQVKGEERRRDGGRVRIGSGGRRVSGGTGGKGGKRERGQEGGGGINTVTGNISQMIEPFPVSAGMQDYFNMNVIPRVGYLGAYDAETVPPISRNYNQQSEMKTDFEFENTRPKKYKKRDKRSSKKVKSKKKSRKKSERKK